MKRNRHVSLGSQSPQPLTLILIGGLLRHTELSAQHLVTLARDLGSPDGALERAIDDLHDRGLIAAAPPGTGAAFIGTLRLTRLEQDYRIRAMVAHTKQERGMAVGHA